MDEVKKELIGLVEFKSNFTDYLSQSKGYRIEDDNPNSDNLDEYRIIKAVDEKNGSGFVYGLFSKGDEAIHNAYEPLLKAMSDIHTAHGKDYKVVAHVVYPNVSPNQKTKSSFFMDPIVFDGKQWIDFYTNEYELETEDEDLK